MYRAMGQFFIPKSASHLTAEDLSAAAAVYDGFLCVKRCKIKRLLFVVTTLVAADTTAPVVEVNHRPTPGSATGEVAIDTITIPDTTAVGQVLYVDVEPVTFEPGEELSFEHITQAADAAAAAGAGYYAVEVEDAPEEPGNETNMVESA